MPIIPNEAMFEDAVFGDTRLYVRNAPEPMDETVFTVVDESGTQIAVRLHERDVNRLLARLQALRGQSDAFKRAVEYPPPCRS